MPRSPPVRQPGPDLASPAAELSNRAQAENLVERLLAEVRLPSVAHRRSSAPVRELRSPGQTTASPNLVDRRAWWTLPGSVSHALTSVKRHGVPGCRFDLSGTSSGSDERTVREIGCDLEPTAFAGEPKVLIEAVSTGHRTAVRADAQAIWIPARPAYSRIVAPSSAHVVVDRDHEEPTVRRTLGHSGAGRLAVVLNRLPVSTPGTYSCPMAFAGYEDDLTFRTSTGRVLVTADLSGCRSVRISVPGHQDVDLVGSIDGTARRLLHLPRSYR